MIFLFALLLPPSVPDDTAAELTRFPAESEVRDWLVFSREYRRNMENVLWTRLHQADDIREAIAVAARSWDAWNTLDSAQQCERWYQGADRPDLTTERRRYLNHLREILGDEAYFTGRMPPPVPLWGFWE